MFTKRLISVSMTFLLCLCLISCSKDSASPSSSLTTAPEADAAEDSKSGGVYKGSFVGSSGTIKATLQKGKIEIILTLDGTSRTLTSTSLANWTSGQSITNAVFTGGDWSVTLSIGADGSNPTIVITIPGHSAILPILYKEKSTSLIKAFEGTYAGAKSGTFNLVIQGENVFVVSRNSDGSGADKGYGTLSGNSINLMNGFAVGTINGDNVSGTWQNPSSADDKGTWSGKRTL